MQYFHLIKPCLHKNLMSLQHSVFVYALQRLTEIFGCTSNASIPTIITHIKFYGQFSKRMVMENAGNSTCLCRILNGSYKHPGWFDAGMWSRQEFTFLHRIIRTYNKYCLLYFYFGSVLLNFVKVSTIFTWIMNFYM